MSHSPRLPLFIVALTLSTLVSSLAFAESASPAAALASTRSDVRVDQISGSESAYSFYDSGATFLSIPTPCSSGEEAFIERAKALSGGGEPFGLVLSGGSARAFAHIGVLKALEEAGVRPDFIVANSMGAIVAMLYGAGVAPEDIERLFEAFPATSLFDLELPLDGGFLDSGDFSSLIRELVGDLDLSHTPIPVLVLCEDVISRRQVRLAKGDFTTVITASFALPAVFEPVPLGEWLLMDGGVTDLVPVEAAYAYSNRIAVATSLYNKKLNFENAFVILNRAFDIGKTRSSVSGLLKHRPPVIRCKVEQLSYMEYSHPREVAKLGYDSTRAVISDILAVSPSRPLSGSLLPIRAYYRDRITAMIAARERGQVFAAKSSSSASITLRPAADAWDGFPYLSDIRYAGLSTRVRSGPFDSDAALLTGLSGKEDETWGGRIALSLAGGTHGEQGVSASVAATGYIFGSVAKEDTAMKQEKAMATAEASLTANTPFGALFRPEVRWEGELLRDGDGAWDLRSGASLSSKHGQSLFADLALFHLADSDGNQGAGGLLRASATFAQLLSLRLRASSRGSWTGPGFDGIADTSFRGPGLDRRSPLRANGGVDAIFLAHRAATDIGEMLIFQKPELGVYADILVTADSATASGVTDHRFVIGLAGAIGVSTLGLAPFDFTFHCGFAPEDSLWDAGLYLGRSF